MASAAETAAYAAAAEAERAAAPVPEVTTEAAPPVSAAPAVAAAADTAPLPTTQDPTRVRLHHLNSSRSERIVWLLEELGVDYDVTVHYRTKIGFAPESLKAINPLGKAPAIELGGKVYTESGAIIHLLLSTFKTPAALEAGPASGQDSVHWSHFAEGSLMLFLQPMVTISRGGEVFASRGIAGMLFGGIVNKFVAWYTGMAADNVKNMLQEVEGFLAAHENFTGGEQLGEGDFMMGYPLNAVLRRGAASGLYLGDKTKAWVARVSARPGYVAAEKRIKDEEEKQRPTKTEE